jgi:aminopeptidase N
MRTLLCIALCLTAAGNCRPQEWRAPESTSGCLRKASGPVVGTLLRTESAGSNSVDIKYYNLDLTVSATPPLLSGRVGVLAASLVDTLSVIILDLTGSMSIDSVRVAGTRVSTIRYAQAFAIALDRMYHRGEIVSCEITYHGTPAATGLGSFVFGQDAGKPWIWTLSEPYGARDWWPCKDHPQDKADSADIRVTCDGSLNVGSNGRLVSVTANLNGSRTYHWAERYPIATYLISVTAGSFAEFSNYYHYSPVDSMEILNYVLPEHLTDALAELPKTVAMLGIFASRFGPYPFLKEKYGHTEFGRGGAMEHQTMTSTTTFNEITIAHELAHQWFGDLITCATWRDLWLNEGFASYGEALYMEGRQGPDAYHAVMNTKMATARNAAGSLYVQDTVNITNLFANPRVYQKGASVLHMLRHILGDTLFFRSLRAYVADPRYRYATATTRDFQGVCESVAGRQLGYFFDQWVFGEKYPVYTPTWSTAHNGLGWATTVTLQQTTRTQNPAFFTMPVDFHFTGPALDTVVTVMHTADGQKFVFRFSSRPDGMEFDPGNWILKDVSAPNAGFPLTPTLFQNYPNPFNGGTTVEFALPKREKAIVRIYSLTGEEIATIWDGMTEPGATRVRWEAKSGRGIPVPSGVYFCRLITEERSVAQKMLVLR